MTTTVPLRRSRRTGKQADVCLIKLPNHNIDYPHLATPTLAARLRSQQFTVEQVDINVELHDYLLTSDALQRVEKELIPQLLRAERGEITEVRRLRRFLEQVNNIGQTIGFTAIEQQKELMQRRDYAAVFGHDATLPPLAVFNVASINRILVDRALALDTLGEPNLVSQFLHEQAARLAAMEPAVVGISLLQIQRRAAIWFARRLKSMGDMTIVIGGPDATSFGADYLRAYECFDAAFQFESEESFARFMNGVPVAEIPGMAYRDSAGEVREHPADHDKARSTFLPDFDGLSLNKYLLPTLPLSASRGCAFAKCKFCNHFRTYSDYYENDARATVDNLQTLSSRYGTRYFHFVDDMLEHSLGTAVANEIVRRGLDLRIMTYARFEARFTPTELDVWSRAGIRLIEWGLESASRSVLRSMSKGIALGKVDELLSAANRAGILSKVLMFHNYPGESVEDLRESIDFLRQRTIDRTLRPFFAIRGRFELRLDTPIEVTSRDDPALIPKRFERSSSLSSLIDYHDGPEYDVKRTELERFLHEMGALVEARTVLPANDDYVSLDLILQDLNSNGADLVWRPI
ncbi:B12-binding domain-containing radical SAM protein [Actinoplanes sp. NPDC051343]|uniref:B12-binding domain-containing radical SAM protein n=1 Tax=Actinoplanes sp. NPDC051343 TaxID=3363906 RepID=UPI0037BCD227